MKGLFIAGLWGVASGAAVAPLHPPPPRVVTPAVVPPSGYVPPFPAGSRSRSRSRSRSQQSPDLSPPLHDPYGHSQSHMPSHSNTWHWAPPEAVQPTMANKESATPDDAGHQYDYRAHWQEKRLPRVKPEKEVPYKNKWDTWTDFAIATGHYSHIPAGDSESDDKKADSKDKADKGKPEGKEKEPKAKKHSRTESESGESHASGKSRSTTSQA